MRYHAWGGDGLRYLTGMYGLNVPDFDLDTTGDWHACSLDWAKATFKESDDTPLGVWGIRQARVIPYPFLGETLAVANHLRSLVDIIAEGRFTLVRGMRRDYLGTDKYDQDIFSALSVLKHSDSWEMINSFMGEEYGSKWRGYCESKHLPSV